MAEAAADKTLKPPRALGSLVYSLSSSSGASTARDPTSWATHAYSQVDSVRALRTELHATKKKGYETTLNPSNSPIGSPVRPPPQALRKADANTHVLEDKLKRRVEKEKFIATALAAGMTSMEQTSFRLKKSNFELQRVSGQLWAYINVSEKRMELRCKRAPEELVKDCFQDALEKEHALLLKEHEEMGKHIIAGEELRKAVEEGVTEMQNNKLTLHVDRSPFPYEFLKSMTDLEVSVRTCVVKAGAALNHAQDSVEKSRMKTTQAMKRRISELEQMRKHIDSEIKQSNSAISTAQQDLRKMGKLLKEKASQAENKLEGSGLDFHTFNSRAKLSFDVLSNVRGKIKAAAYTGHAGRQLDVVFSRFDTDGSGQLDEDEVRSALRRALKIPPSVITDAEVSGLCATLDADDSGSVSIAEIIDFLNSDIDMQALKDTYAKTQAILDQLVEQHTRLVQRLQAVTNAWKIDRSCLTVTPIKGLELDTLPTKPDKAEPGKRKKPLEPRVCEKVRTKIQQAAWAGGERGADQLQELFNQFDADGSGQLDDDELRRALRFNLKIPSYSISDAEISSLCAVLDADNSGAISVSEVMEFIGPAPTSTTGIASGKSIRLKGGRRVWEGSAEHKEQQAQQESGQYKYTTSRRLL